MEDVWIAPEPDTAPPRWLEDASVRKGIQAHHKMCRALEEQKRCGREAENMYRWFGKELLALEIALRQESSK